MSLGGDGIYAGNIMNKGIIRFIAMIIITGMLITRIPICVSAQEDIHETLEDSNDDEFDESKQPEEQSDDDDSHEDDDEADNPEQSIVIDDDIESDTNITIESNNSPNPEAKADYSIAQEAYRLIIEDGMVLALVNRDDAAIYPSVAENIIRGYEDSSYADRIMPEPCDYLECGYTVYPYDVVIVENGNSCSVYYAITYYKDTEERRGYINGLNLTHSSEDWDGWEAQYLQDINGLTEELEESAEADEQLLQDATDAVESIYTDIDSFPASYRSGLVALKLSHPNWTFVPVNTRLDYDSAIRNEMGDKSWISNTEANRNKGFVGAPTGQSGWNYATYAGISYYMDPRNYLDESHIFAFEQLTYNSTYHTEAAVSTFLASTFMKGTIPNEGKSYAKAFCEIGSARKLSPIHLASRVYQEQGKGTSPLISGTYRGFEGYYNYFNVGASGKSDSEIIVNGLTYAKNQGWNTRYKSLEGGAGTIGKNYVLKGQDTIYLEKYNVAPGAANPTYTHQYMQNIQAPYTESATTYKMYLAAGSLGSAFVFKIPVYNNMPLNGEIYIDSVEITGKEDVAEMFTGQQRIVGAKYYPADTTEYAEIEWTSSNKRVATVEDGIITAVGKGTCTITATAGENHISDSVSVKVSNCSVRFMKKDHITVSSSKETAYGYVLLESDFPNAEIFRPTDMEYRFEGWYELVTGANGDKRIGQRIEAGYEVRKQIVEICAYYTPVGQGFTVSPVGTQVYTGQAIKPQVQVYDADAYSVGGSASGTTALVQGVDYTITYKNNKNTGSMDNPNVSSRPAVVITGKGNYSGTQSVYFDIIPRSLESSDVSVGEMHAAFSGSKIMLTPEVYVSDVKLKKGTDYSVSYPAAGNDAYIAEGKWPVKIVGRGGYTGSIFAYENITSQILMSKLNVSKIPDQMYDASKINKASGTGMEPSISVFYGMKLLKKGVDYTVSFKNNMQIGTATAIIRAINGSGYVGSKTVTFKIKGTPMTSVKSRPKNSAGTSSGSSSGIVQKVYSLDATKMLQDNYELYCGNKVLVENTDYVVSYRNADKAGNATIIFTGINGYSGSVSKTYRIAQFDIAANTANMNIELDSEYQYVKGGVKVMPAVRMMEAGSIGTCELIYGRDYTLSYRNNAAIKSSTDDRKAPTVYIKGKGNYTGSIEKTFTIVQCDFAKLDYARAHADGYGISAPDVVYSTRKNGYQAAPVITDANGVKLTAGTDYEKSYIYTYAKATDLDRDGIADVAAGSTVGANDIVPVGTSIRVSVKGKGGNSNYSDAVISCVYTIVKADISSSKVKASVDAKFYTGRAITPGYDDIHITYNNNTKLVALRDYEIVSYGENTAKGTGTIVIKGVGDYGKLRTITFTIKPKGIFW